MARVDASTFDVSGELLTIAPLPIRLGLFQDTQAIKEAISVYVQTEIENAKREAYNEAVQSVEKRVKKELKRVIDRYISTLTEIDDTVIKIAKTEFSAQELKVIEVRTNFYFGTWQVNILFIIDSNLESESRFSSFLTQVERSVLDTSNVAAELLFVNKRGKTLDNDTMNLDFPYSRTLKPIN